jgi:hypothetical protein
VGNEVISSPNKILAVKKLIFFQVLSKHHNIACSELCLQLLLVATVGTCNF